MSSKSCKLDSCHAESRSRGYCKNHYQLYRKYGFIPQTPAITYSDWQLAKSSAFALFQKDELSKESLFYETYVKLGIVTVDVSSGEIKRRFGANSRGFYLSERRLCKPSGLKGYLGVSFCICKKSIQCLSHRVIWYAINGHIPSGLFVNHKNGIKGDNRIDNLELCTASQNTLHAYHVLGVVNGARKLSEESVRRIRAEYKAGGVTHRQLATRFGIGKSAIGRILLNETYKGIE